MTIDPLVVSAASYVAEVDPVKGFARVKGTDGQPWFALRLFASLDTTGGPDETVGELTMSHQADGDAVTVTVSAVSTAWRSRVTTTTFRETTIETATTVTGSGRLTDVHLLGGRRTPRGFLPSGSALRRAFSPNPDHPVRVIRDANEPATIAVCGEGGEPGIERWLFTPAPWCFAVSPGEEWIGLGLLAPVAEQTFTGFHYLPVTGGFSLRLDYEGHTEVTGTFRTPPLVIEVGGNDPYDVLSRHRAMLDQRDLVPRRPAGPGPDWWHGPIFCGWGAQCTIAERTGVPAPQLATQQNYDRFMDRLHAHGIEPSTVVVDDKWQAEYATCRPDPDRWPDLAGWIRDRHADGRRVLLWWKAWDPEGAPVDACVTDAAGRPVSLDPDSPAGAVLVDEAIRFLLSPDGLDADGLKVDFTARTPSGHSLRHHGPHWGAALLHRHLKTVYDAAKAVKPDAMIVTHAPNPAFLDCTDLIRLNDVMTAADGEPGYVRDQLRDRAAAVRSVVPELGIDTDGWRMPDHHEWLTHTRHQAELGVPALYYAEGVDGDGSDFTESDYAVVRDAWAAYRAGRNAFMS